jgi:hypothetical protein
MAGARCNASVFGQSKHLQHAARRGGLYVPSAFYRSFVHRTAPA